MGTIEKRGFTSHYSRRGSLARAGRTAGTAARFARTTRLVPHHALRTRRGLQFALGLLWLLDGALQLQPFMLRAGFARQVLAPAAAGQPHLVAGPVLWGAKVIAAHPVVWDVPFASVQLLIGAGMLFPRTARTALAGSIAWALGVWFFGEGLSGLGSGNASLLSGAPGAVLLYAVLGVAAWPRRGRSDVPPARWLPLAWATLWIGAAVLQALPQNDHGVDVANSLRANGSPNSLAGFDNSLAGWISRHGASTVIVLITVEAVIGLAALDRKTLRLGAGAGLVLTLAIWVIGQNLGGLYTGQATDPNAAPLVALMAIALLDRRRRPRARPLCFFAFDTTSSRVARLAAKRPGLDPIRVVQANSSRREKR
jgi:hypothetical protein